MGGTHILRTYVRYMTARIVFGSSPSPPCALPGPPLSLVDSLSHALLGPRNKWRALTTQLRAPMRNTPATTTMVQFMLSMSTGCSVGRKMRQEVPSNQMLAIHPQGLRTYLRNKSVFCACVKIMSIMILKCRKKNECRYAAKFDCSTQRMINSAHVSHRDNPNPQ